MAEERIFMCDFELVDKGERVLAYPVGLAGVTEGYDRSDAVRMAADWLKETALDYLERGEEWPELPLGTDPTRNGRMISVAVSTSLADVPAVTAAEAAVLLGVSTARVAQLCNEGLLNSWKVGRTRMVALGSIEDRLARERKAGRPRKDPAIA